MVETMSYGAGLARMVKALGSRVAEGDPEDLAVVLDLIRDAEQAMSDGIAGLRAQGHSDAIIAGIIAKHRGRPMSRQAVRKRWPRG